MQYINSQKKSQQGFTLIELVVVIVILGILAVTAAPKFIDLQDDARTATLQAVKASMQSASTLMHSKALIAGRESAASAATAFVTVNSKQTQINYGYPLADYSAAAASNPGNWNDLLELNTNEFTSAVVGGSFVVYPTGKSAPSAIPASPYAATTASNCFAFYTQAASGGVPNIQAVPCL
ncbi:hypothetical protein NBRC116592_21000 [Colwellia sp. KU-HH00111]|uniref:type II secretion system protein n=1 Tax=Colwellia sp. KU-HH00111 TaxID=3127652 RepID=UPI0031067853